jgi:hypothetical protein
MWDLKEWTEGHAKFLRMTCLKEFELHLELFQKHYSFILQVDYLFKTYLPYTSSVTAQDTSA